MQEREGEDVILAVIPARGGSKRIPGKNMALLGRKPLIAHAIDCAKRAKLVDRVVVSTDDLKIAEASYLRGAEVIIRPDRLARDSTPLLPVVRHAAGVVTRWGDRPDVVVVLQPTSPLRTPEDVDSAIRMEAGSLVSVCALDPKTYKKNGAVFLATREALKRDDVFDSGFTAFVMPAERSIDIDTPADLKRARKMEAVKG